MTLKHKQHAFFLRWLGAGLAGGLVALVAVLLLGATQTVTVLPSFTAPPANWGSLTETFLRDEDARRYGHAFQSFIVTGGTGPISGTLSHSVAATTAYVGGYYVSVPATVLSYGANLRTFLYLYSRDAPSASDFSISGGTGCVAPGSFVFTNISGGGAFVQVPCGTTSADPTVTSTNAQYGVLLLMRVDTSATAISAVSRAFNPFAAPASTMLRMHNIRQYGAVGDGVANDTRAIITAQQAAGANGVVYVPEGTYLTDPWADDIPSGQTMLCAGWNAVIRITAQTTSQNLYYRIGGSRLSNLKFINCAFDGNRVNQVTAGVFPYGLSFRRIDDSEIAGNLFQNWAGAGVNLEDSNRNLVKYNVFHNVGLTSTGALSNEPQGISIVSGAYNKIIDNIIYADTMPITISNGGIDLEPNSASEVIEYNEISRNTIVRTAAGVNLVPANSSTIRNNNIHDNIIVECSGNGIYVSNGGNNYRNSFVGNRVQRCQQRGMFVDGQDHKLIGNILLENSQVGSGVHVGMRLQGNYHTAIANRAGCMPGTTCLTSYGIDLGSTNMTVALNDVRNNVTAGINIAAGALTTANVFNNPGFGREPTAGTIWKLFGTDLSFWFRDLAVNDARLLTDATQLVLAVGATDTTQGTNALTLTSAGLAVPTVAFASLGTPADGAVRICSDCSNANPCTGGGGGSIAYRVSSIWRCSS